MKLEAQLYSEIGGRRENEDTVMSNEYGNIFVAVLGDGLGGQGDGAAASKTICESLIRCGADKRFPDRATIETAFEKANQDLLGKQKNDFHMKTTAVYLCVCQNRAIWAHVGDSRLYHLCNGKLCECTLDHSASQLAVFMGQIKREEIPSDPGRSRLLRAMGVRGEKPDIHNAITLEKGRHAFLLCSDGLWEYLTDTEIERAFASAKTAQSFLETLRSLKESRSLDDCDNNSAIAVYVEV